MSDGGTMATLDWPLPLAQGLILLAQVAEELAERHERGEVYGGLTPNTVLVRGDRARLGPAEPLIEDGMVVRNPSYIAPETFRGEPAGAPADVFALGCLVVAVLTGRYPFPGAAACLMEAIEGMST